MMADNLPLIPSKNTVCNDIRPVLRTVFRELDFLPPLATDSTSQRNIESVREDGDHALPLANRWVEQYKSECDEILDHEIDIKNQFAKRTAKEPLSNIFKLHQSEGVGQVPKWKLERGLLDRQDLKPTIEQNAGKNGSLWIKNILNASSCNVSAVKMGGICGQSSASLSQPDVPSIQSYSVGEVPLRPPPPPVSTPSTAAPPQYIVCLPSQLEFVNCTIGHLHTKVLRLVNISKFECRLSVTPTKHRQLHIEISSYRGLVVTPGAAVELKVHFRPTDVRALKDVIAIRVSCGQDFVVPIECFIQPPLLRITVPGIASSIQLSSYEYTSEVRSLNASHYAADVVELGSRLLGDVHCAQLLMHCDDRHATFFLLTEEAWANWNIDCVTSHGSVVSGEFVVCPCAWRGGGVSRARAWCAASARGTHVACLRVACRTAVSRPLHLIADVLLYKREHLAVEAHEKDYDICSDSDPDCEYYLNLGTAFPHRALSAQMQLVNKSPILYNYYWIVRTWGVCCCWDEQKDSSDAPKSEETIELCVGAEKARHMNRENPEAYQRRGENARLVTVVPECGQILPRSTLPIHVSVHDAGGRLGVQRAVIMLILENIPKESLPEDYDPMIVRTRQVESTAMPGVTSSTREVCEVVAAQVEVWWEVVPLQFVLDPPVLSLYHSRRVKSTEVHLRSWQLFGLEESRVWWVAPPGVPSPPPLMLSPARCATTTISLPLPQLPSECPHTDVLTMVDDNGEWKSKCVVTRQCSVRHPTVRPVKALLGVVPPGVTMKAIFRLSNDTYQDIAYCSEAYRWWGENEPRPICVGRVPCASCKQAACTCALVTPREGALEEGQIANIYYNTNAPMRDGLVATLVQTRRCEADCARVMAGPGTGGRAALVAYRVLAPRLTARLLPCLGQSAQCSESCGLDEGSSSSKLGAALLRPTQPLVVGRRACYRLRLANITPLPTAVHFDTPVDHIELLKVKFTPNDFSLKGYSQVDIRVVLDALQVCERRIFVYRALVLRAHLPLYLVIDTAITGVKISCQVPLGGGDTTDDFVIIKRTQRHADLQKQTEHRSSTNIEIFAEEDRRRAFVKENKCYCPFKMVYIPPVKTPKPTSTVEEELCTPIDIVEEPPPLTRICPCDDCSEPNIREAPESISLQFINIRLRKVCERRVLLYNESVVTAQWNTVVRKWPRRHVRTINKDDWCADVTSPGVSIECSPARGELGTHAKVVLLVKVYADSWGLYRDQILIQIENLDPIVLDLWIEAMGAPLQLKMQPDNTDEIKTMWMSTSDPKRSLRIRNISRSDLIVHAYVTKQYECKQDELPFRLYLRFYDLQPIPCPCYTTLECNLEETSKISYDMEMDTGIDVYLAPDFGPQDNMFYEVSPEECSIRAGESMKREIKMTAPPYPELVPDSLLLLRLTPEQRSGECWYRTDPPPQLVRLRQAVRESRLELSCDEVTVHVCALDLPYGNYLRIRKRFQIQNVGTGISDISASTTSPWCLLQDNTSSHRVGNGWSSIHPEVVDRKDSVMLCVPPRSSLEMCVEVCVCTREAWPSDESAPREQPKYEQRRRDSTPLHIYDDYDILKILPLTLDIEYPEIHISPTVLDFGFVTDGDSRKSYVTVSHTSRTNTLQLVTRWDGCSEFEIWPPFLQLLPGGRGRIYIQYTAVWRLGPSEGYCHVSLRGAAGGADSSSPRAAPWCRAVVAVRASPTRDHTWLLETHDHTDDVHLLPPRAKNYVPPSTTTGH